jgi:hypothetical protein
MNLQSASRTGLEIFTTRLADIFALPDPQAAVALNERIIAWNVVDELHERSYVERGLIAVQFEKKKLWKHLIDPDTETHFASFTAWMSCSQFMGCRRTNFEAKADVKALSDVPEDKLASVPKENLKVLRQLSTHVRNEPEVIKAAQTLSQNKFLEQIEAKHADQHLEVKRLIRFSPGRSGARVVEEWISYAIEHDIAGTRDEALVRACEMALDDAKLDEELKNMPEETIA